MKKRLFRAAAVLFSAASLSAALALHGSAAYEEKLVGYLGDVNADMSVNIADAVLLTQYLEGTAQLPAEGYPDMDAGGTLTVSDLTMLKQLLLTQGVPIPIYDQVWVEDPPEVPIESPVQALNPTLPSTGETQILMFTVEFPDCHFHEGYSTEQVWNLAFGPEDKTSDAYPLESITAYYERASYGKLHVNGDVYTYTARHNIDYYVDNTDTLVEEVLAAFDSQIDYHKYDVNSDNKMDTLILALPKDAGTENWWPCSGGYYGWKKYDNVRASNLLIGGWALDDRAGFNSTWIHEMGHGMGLPDYYMYENYSGNDCYGLNGDAGWLMMDDAYGDMCCFDKLMYGWYNEDDVQVYEGGTQTFTLKSSQREAGCILIPRYDDGGYLTEYFMLEYVTHEGNNATWWLFKDGGIRVLHCDAEICEGYWGPEFTWNNYGMYYDTSNQKQRVLRLVNDNGGFFKSGAYIDSNTTGFKWYDRSGYQTVNPMLTISIGDLVNGEYTITISEQ